MEYIGKVIYNEDTTHTGRCKVRVFGLFDNLKDQNIPWFTPMNSSIFSAGGAGSLDVPKIGTIVRVKFSNNDYYSGEYMALQCVDPALVKEIEDDYDGAHVLLYDSDAELVVIYQKMTGLKIYHKGASIILDPTGSIQLKHQNNANVIELNQNNIIITTASSEGGGNNTTGTINISSGNEINITAPNVNVNAENIKLGKTGNDNIVTANRLRPLLMSIMEELKAKSPYGSTISMSQLENIGSNKIKCM